MNTAFLLMAQFNKAVVPLDLICQEYFGLLPSTAKHQAKAGSLPVPAYRATQSNKAPWLVNLSDLGKYLDDCRDKAKKDHIHSHKSA